MINFQMILIFLIVLHLYFNDINGFKVSSKFIIRRWDHSFKLKESGTRVFNDIIDPFQSLKRDNYDPIESEFDVIIIGAGIGGLSSAAILSSVYNLKVLVLESHYHAGGCAHSFTMKSKNSKSVYNFDAGPTILLGCSQKPYNPLRQVLEFVKCSEVEWIPWHSWGMVTEVGHWDFQLGLNKFEDGPLKKFGGQDAVIEFMQLREACIPLTRGAASIPTKSLRGDKFKILPLLPYYKALQEVIPYADVLDGSFKPFMDKYVKNAWLRSWLDALAFSLSGLPADQTGAATMAYTIYDLHREGASMDYPKGGIGKISEALVNVIKSTGSQVKLSHHVNKILIEPNRFGKSRASGVEVNNLATSQKKIFKARKAIISNANIWSLSSLLKDESHKLTPLQYDFLISKTTIKKSTKSFLHLHMGLDVTGLDTSNMKAHYTYMDKGLVTSDPCSDRNMVAVSNPSILDSSLVTNNGKSDSNKLLIHAYGAGNEDYNQWLKYKKDTKEYQNKKNADSLFLYRAIAKSLQIDEQELSQRIDIDLIGTPLTHEKFLLRKEGTYGVSWGEMMESPVTPLNGLYLAGDSIFPGIGVPAVALSGAIAANSVVNVISHLKETL